MDISLLTITPEMLSLVADHHRLGIADLEKLTSANRSTIKKHLSDLTEASLLLRHGKGRATWYTLS